MTELTYKAAAQVAGVGSGSISAAVNRGRLTPGRPIRQARGAALCTIVCDERWQTYAAGRQREKAECTLHLRLSAGVLGALQRRAYERGQAANELAREILSTHFA